MQKYSFLDDYSEGCHPNILEALSKYNLEQDIAYGFDLYSMEAKKKIKNKINNPLSEIYFVTGGTQANLIITSASLRSHEAVVSVETGHVAMRESGALEATGHKIIEMPSSNGKINITIIQKVLDNHTSVPHMVKPKLVYISNATEIGTIYTKEELEEISAFCKEKNLFLFLDGARLGSALSSNKNDLTLEDLGRLVDVFTIGATKNGALFGEAIVLNNTILQEDFNVHIKQRGALLAKGRTLGIQFLELFKDNLYFELSQKANYLALKISDAFEKKAYKLLDKTQTNQIFLILPNSLISKLEEKFSFYVWSRYDEEHSVVRMVTSWTTDENKVEELISSI